MYRSGLVRSPARDAQRGPRPRERLLGGDLGEEVGAQLRDARRGHGVLEERPRRRRWGHRRRHGLQQVQFPNYQVDHVLDNVELRVSFLRNLISESEFKVKLQRNHKAHQKKEEVRDILHLFIQTVTDIVLRALDHAPKIKHLDEMKPFFVESNAILDYANKCLEKVASHFNSKPKKLRYITPHDTHALY